MAIDFNRMTAGATAPASVNNTESKKNSEEKNVGGFIGGLGYLGEKAAVGFVQSVEGIADYTAAGLAKLFGADDFAEKQMKEDWFGDWYEHPDEWYKPSKGWQFAGDVASGIGTSLPTLATGIGATALTVASGGTAAAPMLAGAFGGGITAGLSSAGSATKEAYAETGELGGEEFAYGFLSGVAEGGAEALTNALTLGTGAILKNVGKSIAKEAVETVSRQAVVKGMLGAFAGEAFEEGFTTWISPKLKRMTYDPHAKDATFSEISYSAITGGIAGMVMDGGNIAINAAANIKSGANAANRGLTQEILGLSERIAKFEDANKTGNEAYEAVSKTYKKLSESLAKTGGEVKTTEQYKLLGELQRGNTAAVFTPMVSRAAAEIYANAENIAPRLNEYGYADTPITAEMIRDGVNPDDARSFAAALKSNTLLRNLAVADVTGHLVMNTQKFKNATLAGKTYASQADLNRFAETATPEEIRAVSEALGIESWETLTPEAFEEKVVVYMTRGGESVSRVDAALPNNMGTVPNNTVTEPNNTVTVSDNTVTAPDNDIGAITKENARTAEEFARDNVRGYNELSATNQGMIRKVIRAASASGLSQSDAKTYAEVSAHSGIDIVFDKAACRVGDGYADGFYDPEKNRIVVNPDGTRSAEKLLLHELDHAIRLAYGKDGRAALVEEAYLGLSPEEAQKITAKYKKIGADSATILDEANAYFAETALTDAGVLEKLIRKEKTLGERIIEFFSGAKEAYKGEKKLEGAAKRYEKLYREMFRGFAEANKGRNAAEAKTRGMSDVRFSLQFADDIAENQRKFVRDSKAALTPEELELAIEQTAEMVEIMSEHKNILPEDKIGKTLVKNGSYDYSVENTTICVRTLAYNSFTDMVSKKIGRPLTQMESFLVSQKLYEIAKEPQCLYCYVSLDRKAYNEMLLRYITQRDEAIADYIAAGKPKVTENSEIYKKFLAGRKPTTNMWNRYKSWTELVDRGDYIVPASDIATEADRAELARKKDGRGAQVKDMLEYAQRASWAKKQTQYVAYFDDILKLSPAVIKNLNKHYGLRWYSFSDYSGAFIVENMQQVTDAAIRGLKGLAYTKDTDYARIFAPTGMNINISVYAKKTENGYIIDERQSANLEEAIKLREQYPNVGIVAVATDKAGVEWALAQEWSDVVIPFHTVRTGADVAEFYQWETFNTEQSDTVKNENLWNAYVESLTAGDAKKAKKVSKMVYPSEHQNNRETYLRIINERGLKPRFEAFLANENYMKLVNETRQSEADTKPLTAKYDLAAAKTSFDKFVEKGGYFEGWYNDGIDVDGEASLVASDIAAGKKANEVSYGRQDVTIPGRRTVREHGRKYALADDDDGLPFIMDTLPEKAEDLPGNLDLIRASELNNILPTFDNTQREKKYSRKSAMSVINSLPNTYHMSKSEQNRFIKSMHGALEACESVEQRVDFANAFAKAFVDSTIKIKIEHLDVKSAVETQKELRAWLGKLSFSKRDITELEFLLGRDEAKRFLRKWQRSDDIIYPLDVFLRDFEYEMPKYRNAVDGKNSIDAIVAIDRIYEKAKARSSTDRFYEPFRRMSDTERAALEDITVKGVLNGFAAADREITAQALQRVEQQSDYFQAKLEEQTAEDRELREAAKENFSKRAENLNLRNKETREKLGSALKETRSELSAAQKLAKSETKRADTAEKRAEKAEAKNDYYQAKLEEQAAADRDFRELLQADYEHRVENLNKRNEETKEKYADYLTTMRLNQKNAELKIKSEAKRADTAEKRAEKAEAKIGAAESRAKIAEQRETEYRAEMDMMRDEIAIEKRMLADKSRALKELGRIATRVERLDDLRKGTFKNSTIYKDDTFDKLLDELRGIEWQKNFIPSRAVEAMKLLDGWYRQDNLLLGYKDDTDTGLYDKDLKSKIQMLASLDDVEISEPDYLRDLDEVLCQISQIIETHNKVYLNGKWVDVIPVAKDYVDKLHSGSKISKGFFTKLFRNYLETYMDVSSVMKYYDRYSEGGFYGDMFKMLREAAMKSDVEAHKIMTPYEAFMDSHKNYLRRTEKQTVKFMDVEMPKMTAISLLMTIKRDHAHKGLVVGGFQFKDTNNEIVRVHGFAPDAVRDPYAGMTAAERREAELKDAGAKVPEYRKIYNDAKAKIADYRAKKAEAAEKIREIREKLAKESDEAAANEYRREILRQRELQAGYNDVISTEKAVMAEYKDLAFFEKKNERELLAKFREGRKTAQAQAILDAVGAKRAELEQLLTDEDMLYISVLEDGYNNGTRNLKAERDLEKYGFTNVLDEYYYPIRRANTAKSIDSSFTAEMDRVSSASFNKDIVRGAAGELFIQNADVLYRNHVHAVCRYYSISPAIDAFNRIFRVDIAGDPRHPISVGTESVKVWEGGEDYMRTLIADMQGIPRARGKADKILGGMRSGFAKFQLGANPKTVIGQTSSLFAATSIIDYDSLIKSVNISGKDVDKYSDLAMLRNADNTAAIAQGVLSPVKRIQRGVDTVSDTLMNPIGMMDRFVVTRLFAASQYQIEKDGGAAVGTEENRIAAGKLLERVIFDTQQNSFSTERSEAMRGSSEVRKTLTMFSADAMKVTSRVIDAYGEASALRERLKNATDAEKDEIKKRLEVANKHLGRSIAAMALAAAWSAGIAQLFRWLYNKDRAEDETVVSLMLTDFGGSLLGGLPIAKELYSQFTDGFGIENHSLAMLNDMLAAVEDTVTFLPDVLRGKASAEDIPGKIKSMSYAIGQFTGIPVRNIYNTLYGITKRIAPNAAYLVDDFFYKKNYTADLVRAVERGDSRMARMLASSITGRRVGDVSDEAAAELHRLTMAGFSVLPKEISSTFTADGTEYTMTADELSQVTDLYGARVEDGLGKLVASKGFASLTDTAKADAIKNVYQLAYGYSMEQVFGIDAGNAAAIAEAIGADKVALAYTLTKGLSSDIGKDGKAIAGSKRRKIIAAIGAMPISLEEKLLLIRMKGYSLRDGDVKGISAAAAQARLERYVKAHPLKKRLEKIIKQ